MKSFKDYILIAILALAGMFAIGLLAGFRCGIHFATSKPQVIILSVDKVEKTQQQNLPFQEKAVMQDAQFVYNP